MFSRLATAPGRSDDPADNGWLEVHEVLGISVRSSLVFLSGCETGLGAAWSTEFAAGEDFATLARAFLYAGARNVVATLWRVDDRGAAEFATRFYRHFPAVPAAEALVDGSGETVADPGQNVLALYRKCPHLGCNIPPLCEASHWFECLCHGSKYNIIGEKRAGPAPRGMDRFAVTLTEGVYSIDTGAIVSGPPIGAATFDNRDTNAIPHCAA